MRVTEHLAKSAKVMDRMTVMRTVNHHVIDEHAFATNLVHTGRMISGVSGGGGLSTGTPSGVIKILSLASTRAIWMRC